MVSYSISGIEILLAQTFLMVSCKALLLHTCMEYTLLNILLQICLLKLETINVVHHKMNRSILCYPATIKFYHELKFNDKGVGRPQAASPKPLEADSGGDTLPVAASPQPTYLLPVVAAGAPCPGGGGGL